MALSTFEASIIIIHHFMNKEVKDGAYFSAPVTFFFPTSLPDTQYALPFYLNNSCSSYRHQLPHESEIYRPCS